MCGIVGYIGQRSATEVLVNGLEQLEERIRVDGAPIAASRLLATIERLREVKALLAG